MKKILSLFLFTGFLALLPLSAQESEGAASASAEKSEKKKKKKDLTPEERAARRAKREQKKAEEAAAASSTASDPLVMVSLPAGKLKPEDEVGPIVLGGEKVVGVLNLLQKLSGRLILAEEGLPDGKINFNSQGKLRRDEAILALETLLSLHGVSLTPMNDQFIQAHKRKDVFRTSVPVFGPDGLPVDVSEQYTARIFHLKHLRSKDAFKTINKLKDVGAALFDLPATNALLVVDSVSKVHYYESLIERMDRPPEGRMGVYFFPIKNVSSRQILDQFNRVARRSLKEEFRDSNFHADQRTNQLVVTTLPTNVPLIEKMIEQLDTEVAPLTTSKVIRIEHNSVWNVHGPINQIIRNQQRIWRQLKLHSSSQNEEEEAELESEPLVGLPEGEGAVEGETPNVEAAIAETLPALSESGENMPDLLFSPYIVVVPEHRANTMIVYGTPADIERVEQLVRELDVDVAPITTTEVFQLRHARADTLQRTLNSLIHGQRGQLRHVLSSQNRVVVRDGSQAQAAPAGALEFQFSPYVTLTADRRINAIIAYGTKRDIRQIADMITKTDIAVAPLTTSKVFHIKHSDAQEITRILQSIVAGQQRIRQREDSQTRQYREGEGPMPSENGESGDDLQFSPYISLSADKRSNSIICYGTQSDISQIENVIGQIDIVLAQVRIEVVIVEVALINEEVSGLERFGIDFKKPVDGLLTPGEYNLQTRLPTAQGATDPALLVEGSLRDFSLRTVFGIAKEDRHIKILSAPTIVTTHNQRANISVGETRPLITSSATNLNNADLVTRSTVEFRDIGINLVVRPLIGDNGVIQMEVEQSVETVVDTTRIDNNEQPIIGTRRATSFLTVRDQEVIVMAGLQSVDANERDGEMTLLGHIPLLGEAFSPTSDREATRELIIFIKPFIVESTTAAGLMGDEALRQSSVGDEVADYLEQGRFREQIEMKERMDARKEEEEEDDDDED